jgi:excisionase family DNA binding protein
MAPRPTQPRRPASAADPQTQTVEHDAFRERDAPFPYVQDMTATSAGARRTDPGLIPYRSDRLAISVSEAAAVLGCSVSTVYRMIRASQLRSARSTANGRIFVNLQSVRDFVNGEAEFAAARSSERKRQLG